MRKFHDAMIGNLSMDKKNKVKCPLGLGKNGVVCDLENVTDKRYMDPSPPPTHTHKIQHVQYMCNHIVTFVRHLVNGCLHRHSEPHTANVIVSNAHCTGV